MDRGRVNKLFLFNRIFCCCFLVSIRCQRYLIILAESESRAKSNNTGRLVYCCTCARSRNAAVLISLQQKWQAQASGVWRRAVQRCRPRRFLAVRNIFLLQPHHFYSNWRSLDTH